MKNIKVGIIGGAGYTGGELLRILLNHPYCDIVFVNSQSQKGKPVYHTHADLIGETEICFTDTLDFKNINTLFLCSGHGQSRKFLEENLVPDNIVIIDLSTDYRNESDGFVYGLPELNFEKLTMAKKIANPGCFATSIQLALLPLAASGLLNSEVHVSAITGSTGAGQSLSTSTHFSWRNNNISIYKAFTHQHLSEINQSLKQLQNSFNHEINFIPYRGNFTRGIMANLYFESTMSENEAVELFENYYRNHPFIFISHQEIDLKMVVNSNKCILQIQKHGNKLLVSSIIDNLIKGASGQAVQNMNIAFGLDQKEGLWLKMVAF